MAHTKSAKLVKNKWWVGGLSQNELGFLGVTPALRSVTMWWGSQ